MTLTNNAKATLLLCSHLALQHSQAKPLTLKEWNELAECIVHSSVKEPANLILMNAEQMQMELGISSEFAKKLETLMSRGANLAFSIDELERKSIYILTRSDDKYPARLKKLLGKNCPPVVFYCGDLALLNEHYVAIVGSRDIDEDGQQFAIKLAEKAVSQGYGICSGGARGVDQLSEETALLNGGKCISIVADSMTKKIKLKNVREYISSGKLLLLSAVHPESPFSVGNAMARNKYVYALSQAAYVVASDYIKGGTWAGAVENLKNHWVNTFVWNTDRYKGNVALIKLGAYPINDSLDSFSTELIDKSMAVNEQISLYPDVIKREE